jgi:glucose/arabinose dehydrogenase
MLGDDHPKEELNIIQQGKHYGWPYCYESQIFDKNFGLTFDCSKTEASAYTFTAHMAPLGLTFYREGCLLIRIVCLSHFTVLGIDLSQLAIK